MAESSCPFYMSLHVTKRKTFSTRTQPKMCSALYWYLRNNFLPFSGLVCTKRYANIYLLMLSCFHNFRKFFQTLFLSLEVFCSKSSQKGRILPISPRLSRQPDPCFSAKKLRGIGRGFKNIP
jgi:hypothetical protein